MTDAGGLRSVARLLGLASAGLASLTLVRDTSPLRATVLVPKVIGASLTPVLAGLGVLAAGLGLLARSRSTTRPA